MLHVAARMNSSSSSSLASSSSSSVSTTSKKTFVYRYDLTSAYFLDGAAHGSLLTVARLPLLCSMMIFDFWCNCQALSCRLCLAPTTCPMLTGFDRIVVASFCDGSVRNLDENIDASVYTRLITPAGSRMRSIPGFLPESTLSGMDF